MSDALKRVVRFVKMVVSYATEMKQTQVDRRITKFLIWVGLEDRILKIVGHFPKLNHKKSLG